MENGYPVLGITLPSQYSILTTNYCESPPISALHVILNFKSRILNSFNSFVSQNFINQHEDFSHPVFRPSGDGTGIML